MSVTVKLSGVDRRVAVATAARAARAERVAWIDVAKGIGILLVVVGHAIGGLIDAGITPATDWFRPLMLAIYLFHMPLFFFLSGLFIPDRLQGGAAGIGRRTLTGLVWPYVLWGGTQILVISAAGSLVNAPVVDVPGALKGMLFVSPPSQFWFLYVLALMHLLAVLLLPLIGAVGFVGLGCLAFLAMPADLPIVLSLGARMMPFFALGCLVGARGWVAAPVGLDRRLTAAIVLAAAIVCGSTMAYLIAASGPDAFATLRAGGLAGLAWHHAAFPAAIAATAAVAIMSAQASGTLKRTLAYLGQRSMPIYVLHVLALAGTRILMTKGLGISTPMLFPLLVFVGTVVPLAAAEVARRLRIARFVAL